MGGVQEVAEIIKWGWSQFGEEFRNGAPGRKPGKNSSGLGMSSRKEALKAGVGGGVMEQGGVGLGAF